MCATTGVCDGADVVAGVALTVPVEDAGRVAGVAVCATVVELLLASNRLPPIPKNDATLRPASRIRVPLAGWRRRAR